MSYEIIERNQYGILVKKIKSIPAECEKCKYTGRAVTLQPCKSCKADNSYYLSDLEATKLETEQIFKDNLSEIDSIFNSDIDTTENKKLNYNEFIIETKKILSKIDKELQTAYMWVRVTEEEYEEQDCDNCKGGCVIVRNGKELNCTPDKMDGGCFVLDFQYESFVEEIENIMFHNPTYLFYDLLSCDIETSDSQKEILDLQIENDQLKERIKELKDKYECNESCPSFGYQCNINELFKDCNKHRN